MSITEEASNNHKNLMLKTMAVSHEYSGLAAGGGLDATPTVMLGDAYELWRQSNHPGKAGHLNRDRSQTDLLNTSGHCLVSRLDTVGEHRPHSSFR
jgi:hypothetical protein